MVSASTIMRCSFIAGTGIFSFRKVEDGRAKAGTPTWELLDSS